jgi:isoleucyl-tRNA synthetase
LVPTDDVKLAYSVLSPLAVDGVDGAGKEEKAANTEVARLEAERQVEQMFAQQAPTITKAASQGVVKARESDKDVVAEEETEVKDVRLLLRLLRV